MKVIDLENEIQKAAYSVNVPRAVKLLLFNLVWFG
jgi:hypothetical protein